MSLPDRMARVGNSGRVRFRAEDRARKAIGAALSLTGAELSTLFTEFDAARIERTAREVDTDPGLSGGALAGLTVSIKDLFDEAGFVTSAGSAVLRDAPAATADAPAVARLKAAGAVPCGRTAMSEFAYSGVGLNPHFGNPGNALDPARITGGSTSGGAVTVAKGLCEVALGSDTGGSVRIPAALNGLAGFKPTQTAVPLDGAFPLSGTFDSIGPLARDIATCALVHSVLSQSRPEGTARVNPRLGVPQGVFLDGLDAQVSADFERALTVLSQAGFEIAETDPLPLADYGLANRVIVAREAHAIHRDRLAALEAVGDPRVLRRIRAAEEMSEQQETDLRAMRSGAVAGFAAAARDVDAFLAPTIPTVAPRISEVEADFDRLNALMLRNPSAINFLDGCAATLPMQGGQALATGLMVFAPGGQDWAVLDIAARIETALAA